jgi:hypothetical protein
MALILVGQREPASAHDLGNGVNGALDFRLYCRQYAFDAEVRHGWEFIFIGHG